MKAITGELDLNLFNADDEDNTSFDPAAAMDTLKTVGEFALDMTPVVGDIKGAVELPEDLAMAKQMIEQGYDEGDIMSMGLGGALGALSVAGLVPMAGSLADAAQAPVKAAVKSRLAEQTDAMLDKGLAERGRKTVDVEEAEFSGEPRERPVPKVFHGARSMQQAPKSDVAEGIVELEDMQKTYINDKSDALFDRLRDKRIGAVQGQSYNSPDQTLHMDDILEFQDNNPYNMIEVPVLRSPNEPIDVLTVKIQKSKSNSNLYKVLEFDTDKGEVKDVIGFISTGEDNTITKGELDFTFKSISDAQSKVLDRKSTARTRADKIRDEGFEPFSDFVGEEGLDKFATGQHAELKEQMLSTSLDPLVAMKPGFGGQDTRNIVYSDLPDEQVLNLTPKKYTNVTSYANRLALPQRDTGQIGYKLPKSLHLEAEIAVTNPELLNPKLLSDNPDLAAKIQRGQDVVDSLVSDEDLNKAFKLQSEEEITSPIKAKAKSLLKPKQDDNLTFNAKYGVKPIRGMDRMQAEKLYKDVRKSLNDLQSLGQFTEQYGARGTYDDVLETLVDGSLADNLIKAAGEFPENSVKGNHLYGLAAVIDTMKQNLKGAGYNATQRNLTSTRGISDEVLYDAIYKGKAKDRDTLKKLEDAGIEISGDGDPNISRYDVGYNDLKRLLFLATEKLNKGGLASRK